MYQSSEPKRIIFRTLMIFLFGVLVYNIGLGPINGAGLIYTGMILYWAYSVYKRSVEDRIKKRILLIAVLMLLLLVFRGIRYTFGRYLPSNLLREFWYLYYLPFTFIPLITLDAALLTGKGANVQRRKLLPYLYIFCALLNLMILSNDFHELAFRFTETGRQTEQNHHYDYGVLYYLTVFWIAGCTLTMLQYLFNQNRSYGNEKNHCIFLIVLLIPGLYFLSYYLGLFPMLRGRRFLQLPEAYCFFFICLMEYCLEVGWFPVQILKEKESEMREAAIMYEKRNTLYSAMTSAVSGQLREISRLLTLSDYDDQRFRPVMSRACVLTAYIKRRCNMVLKEYGQKLMPLEELRLSIAESLEYLRLCHIIGAVFSDSGSLQLPGAKLIAAYDFFEEAAELAMNGAEALMVNISARGDTVELRMTLEHPLTAPTDTLPGTAKIEADEDTYYISWSSDFLNDSSPINRSSGTEPDNSQKREHTLEGTAYTGKRNIEPEKIRSKPKEDSKDISDEFTELGILIKAYTIEKEQLDARIRLHDDLGKMLLLARRYIQGSGDKESMLSVWRCSSHLLETEDADPVSDGYRYMESVARDVGIRLVITGDLPEDAPYSELVITAIHECLTNTLRHAHGEELRVLSRDGRIEITNDGEPPKGPVRESGGLNMLRKKAEALKVSMVIESSPVFRLILDFGKVLR